jgi:uncharacterized membrane protein YobD (UPF0266 family)
VAWISLGTALAIAARLWKDRALLWQTHVLAVLAVGWTLYANFAPEYRGTPVQWRTVGITAALLYALTWITNIATVVEDERFCQGYAWAGSLLLSWLAWYQLPPIYVTLVWGLFGLLLFEIPDLARSLKINFRSPASWRMQAYVALAGSFAHMFYSNFNAQGFGAAFYLLLPLPLIYFYIYWQLTRKSKDATVKVRSEYFFACTVPIRAASRHRGHRLCPAGDSYPSRGMAVASADLFVPVDGTTRLYGSTSLHDQLLPSERALLVKPEQLYLDDRSTGLQRAAGLQGTQRRQTR